MREGEKEERVNSQQIVLTITHEGVCSLHFMLMGESVCQSL